MRRTKPIPRDALKVRRSQAGFGLFAAHPIRAGMYLEYVGTRIPTKDADRLKGARYLFEVSTRVTINGAPRENIARYINHSCEPNCESVQRGTRIFIKALRDIAAGEELCYDYGEEYVDEFIKPHGCRCRKCL